MALQLKRGVEVGWLAGTTGDALHAVLCAAGFNLRWLLRSIAGGRIKPIFWACFLWSLSTIRAISAMLVLPDAHKCSEPTNRMPALLRVRAEFATI